MITSNNNKTFKELYKLVNDNCKTNEDIIKLKDILEDKQLGKVDMKPNNSLSIKIDNIDKNIIINFSLDRYSSRSFSIGYEREKTDDDNGKNKKKGGIEKKYLDEVCYPTKRNGIRKILTIGGKIEKMPDKKTDGVEEQEDEDMKNDKKSDNTEKPKDEDDDKRTEKEHFDDMWKLLVQRSCAEKGVIEHHLVINPKKENLPAQALLDFYKDCRIMFYKDYLGQHFNHQKQKQIEFFTAVEYGNFYKETGKKDTHLHIILKTKNQDMLNKFHKTFEYYLQARFGERADYQYKLVDKPDYRINVYNYILKEGNECYTHSDFFYKRKKIDLENPEIVSEIKHSYIPFLYKLPEPRKIYKEKEEVDNEVDNPLKDVISYC